MFSRSFGPRNRGRIRALPLGVAAVACIASLPASALADDAPGFPGYNGYPGEKGESFFITDRVGLPGQSKPDWVSAGFFATSFTPFDYSPGVRLIRNGAVISGPKPAGTYFPLGDVQDGDIVVAADLWTGTEHARFTYRKRPALDGPVCAGAASYSGARDARGTIQMSARAVAWAPGGPGPTGDPDYPKGTTPPRTTNFPGYYPGYVAPGVVEGSTTIDAGGRFTFVPDQPLAAGTHVYVSEYEAPQNGQRVSLETDQVVVDCPKPTGGGGTQSEPIATPTPTPASSAAPGPRPDLTAPTGTLTGITSKALRKLGRLKFLRTGVPITVETNEAGQLVGTLTLLGGKKPVAFPVGLPLFKGRLITHIRLSNGLRKALKKIDKPRLRLDVALVDAAGNRQPLPPIAVDVPRK